MPPNEKQMKLERKKYYKNFTLYIIKIINKKTNKKKKISKHDCYL